MPKPRQVAVALVIATDSLQDDPKFLMVLSRKHKDKWVLPKGGIESGEEAREAAARESWEEAGLIQGQAMHLDHLIVLPDAKPHDKSPSATPSDPSFIPSTTYSFEIFSVQSEGALSEDFPEKHERQVKWVHGWDALEEAVKWGRREDVMVQAVQAAKKRLSG